MSRRIVVTSGKGGVGKTTVCVMLGMALAALNKKVVILDLDFSLNNLDVVAAVENKVVYDIGDVVSGRCRVKQAMIEVERNLYVIQSGHSFSDNVNGQNVRLLIDGLKNYDFVLLDCPAGIGKEFARAVASANEAIVLVNPTLSSLRDADKVVNILLTYKLDDIFAVVNKVRGDLIIKDKLLSVEDVEDIIKLPVIGAIPDDDEVLISSGGELKTAGAMRAVRLLAKRLVKGDGKLYDCLKEYKGIAGRIKMALKKRA